MSAMEDALPTGWSLQKKAYVETFQVDKSKPLSENIVIIPNLISDIEFATFWRQVCENAGAVVLIADNLGILFFRLSFYSLFIANIIDSFADLYIYD